MRSAITLRTVHTMLSKLYKPPKTFLSYRTPIDLVVVTILSAQCTDKRVNELSKDLFKKYKKPEDYVQVKRTELERDIKSTGFYRMKAKHIQELCHILLQDYGGEVPDSMAELTKLPGIGRKTAAILLYVLFAKTEGIPVDTHVFRLARRLGLSRAKSQDAVERDLMKALPKKHWGVINPLLVSHGRAVCTARNRKCAQCVFRKKCPSSTLLGQRDLAQL